METILHAGLSNAISATFLALLVACLSRVLARRPAVLHCLWLLVLLKLVTPPLYRGPDFPGPRPGGQANRPAPQPPSSRCCEPANAISLLDADLGERFVVNELPREFDSIELIAIADRPEMEDRVLRRVRGSPRVARNTLAADRGRSLARGNGCDHAHLGAADPAVSGSAARGESGFR